MINLCFWTNPFDYKDTHKQSWISFGNENIRPLLDYFCVYKNIKREKLQDMYNYGITAVVEKIFKDFAVVTYSPISKSNTAVGNEEVCMADLLTPLGIIEGTANLNGCQFKDMSLEKVLKHFGVNINKNKDVSEKYMNNIAERMLHYF